MLTAEQFLTNYPEFAPLHLEDSALITAVLARAERRIGAAWPAAVRDDIVALSVAHMLSLTPMGRAAKLSEPGMPTAYQTELMDRKKAFACARSRVVV